MGELVITPWRRYGKHRLYASTPDGKTVGYYDVLTGTTHLDAEERGAELLAAVTDHLAEQSPAMSARPAELAAPSRVPGQREEPSWVDLAANQPGQALLERAQQLRAQAPMRTLLSRVLGVHTDERANRIGGQGERMVGELLARLGPAWHTIHGIKVGHRGSDIDHVVIGPGGVFTLNTKHHPGANVWVGGNTFLVAGHYQPYVRNSRHEASRASRVLTKACGFPVFATGVIVVIAGDLTVRKQPTDVHVIARTKVRRWLQDHEPTLGASQIDAVFEMARRDSTWT